MLYVNKTGIKRANHMEFVFEKFSKNIDEAHWVVMCRRGVRPFKHI